MSIFECFRWVLASEQRYLAEIILTQLTIKVPNFGPKNSNFACKSQIFRISFQKMLRSLGLGLGLETFAKFLRVSVLKNLVSEKSLVFGFGKFGLGEKVLVSVRILVASFRDHGTHWFHDSFVFITWQRWDRRRILKKPEGGDKKSSPLSFGRGGKKCRWGFGHLKSGSDSDKTFKRQIFLPCFGPRTT